MTLPPADDADERADGAARATTDDGDTTASADGAASDTASTSTAEETAGPDAEVHAPDPEVTGPDAEVPAPDPEVLVPAEGGWTAPSLPTAEPVTLVLPDAAATPAGQHAAPRPYPPVTPATARTLTGEQTAVLPDAVPADPPPAPPAPRADDPTLVAPPVPFAVADTPPPRPVLPDLPRRPGAGRHVLGVLVGLLLTPVGLVLAAMGVGHMVDLPAGDGALTDPLGLAQLALGALVLGAVAYLGRWSPAVPITGGALWGLGGGGLALWDPAGVSDAVHEVTDGRFAQVAIDHILQPAQTGSLLVVGVVLLAAGIATGRARRSGRLFGVGTTLAQAARAEAERS